jgi:hypothetical protein
MYNRDKLCTRNKNSSAQHENKDAEPSVDQAISGVKSDLQASAPFTFRDWLLRLTTPLNTATLETI